MGFPPPPLKGYIGREATFGRVTLLFVMERGELGLGTPAMRRMPLTATVLLIMTSRREAWPDTDAHAKTCISTDAAKYAHTYKEANGQTQTLSLTHTYIHLVPHRILFSILPLSYKSSVWYDRVRQ